MIIHLPVMVREVLEVLGIAPGGTYVDATVGLGGHAERILGLLNAEGRIIGIDRDEEALRMARERLTDRRVILKKGKFSEVKDIVGETGLHGVDGVFFDFGVSMMQFRAPGRGFSFHAEEPLDMRMNGTQRMKAEDIVNTYQESELERIFREYGEEKYAKRIAKAIGAHRMKKRVTMCTELAEIVSAVYRRRGRIHPATKTFQALRIAVNDEVAEIEKGLEGSMDVLRSGGRLCTISYHSLEDRTVKNFMRDAQKDGLVRIITKKPLSPSHDEVRSNPSSRSAKLRGAERL
ncbi:MAG TPA: 16S rRNA (cytosine(1402)-N(4))-methyltransferase [Nitrospiraceae bacterium]|jgi:16S rRNA (cytosine1402-N4)-methyltransferase|nr:16S rRNA (cytosine(1402)-N(4))-methyltransferase [Nitrospiraceae bacterium]